MHSGKFQELVLQELKAMSKDINGLQNGQQSLEHGQRQDRENNEKFQRLVVEHFNKVYHEIGSIHHEIGSIHQEVEAVHLSQVRMEHDNGEKFAAIFDELKNVKETLTGHTDRLQRIEEKVSEHDIKIHVLDKTKSNKRRVK